MNDIKLTAYSRSSGCGCKISPAVLDEILGSGGTEQNFPSLLVGYESKDDAAVLDTGGDEFLISTLDFFMPVVDDAFDFGRIAAANAISDVYAMGGRPVLALSILGFPVDKLPAVLAARIIAGARTICLEAGIPLAGGHSIDSQEPLFGLSVNGLVKKKNLRTNSGAKEGDLLFLTKALGTGIMASALKKGKLRPEDQPLLTDTMVKLNSVGMTLSEYEGVHTMTDVTGFGFLGHLIEVCEASGLSAEIDFGAIPLLGGLEHYTSQFILPDATFRNWNACEKKIQGISGPAFMPLCDPQTNGGLLLAVDPAFHGTLKSFGKEFERPVGRMISRKEFSVKVNE